MPTIDELIHLYKEKPKKFQKKTYRPWDIQTHYPDKQEEEKKTQEETPAKESSKKNPKNNGGKRGYASGRIRKRRMQKGDRIVGDNGYYFLSGSQKDILVYLIQRAESIKDNICYTHKITQKEIAIFTDCDIKTVSVALNRLKSKGILSTYSKKTGKGGYAQYKINNIDYIKTRLEIL